MHAAADLYERHRLAERCATVVTANRQIINSAAQSRPDKDTHPSSTAGRQAQATGSDRTHVGDSSLRCSCKPSSLMPMVYVQYYVNARHVSNNCAARAKPSVSLLVDSKGFPSVQLTKPLHSLSWRLTRVQDCDGCSMLCQDSIAQHMPAQQPSNNMAAAVDRLLCMRGGKDLFAAG